MSTRTYEPQQWPYWMIALAIGVVVTLFWSIILGVIILAAVNYIGMFVMGRRLALRKGRSPNIATLWVLIAGWIAVLVYATMATPQPVRFEPFRVTRY